MTLWGILREIKLHAEYSFMKQSGSKAPTALHHQKINFLNEYRRLLFFFFHMSRPIQDSDRMV